MTSFLRQQRFVAFTAGLGAAIALTVTTKVILDERGTGSGTPAPPALLATAGASPPLLSAGVTQLGHKSQQC